MFYIYSRKANSALKKKRKKEKASGYLETDPQPQWIV